MISRILFYDELYGTEVFSLSGWVFGNKQTAEAVQNGNEMLIAYFLCSWLALSPFGRFL